MANIINTRICLKYDEYSAWTTSPGKDLVLEKGEIGFCAIPEGNATATNAPTVLFKVGDGTHKFSELNWASGLAADVYAWAKKPNPDWSDFPALPIEIIDNDTGKFVTGFSYADNKLTIARADVQWTDVKNAPDFALSANLGDVSTLTTTAKTAVGAINEHDVEIGDLTKLNTTNKDNLVAAVNEALQAVEVGGTGSVVTVTKQAAPTEGSEVTYIVNQGGKGVDVKIEIPKYDTSADYGVLSVTASDDTITIGGTEQSPTIAVTANKFDAYGAAEKALKDAKDYADAKPHENSAHEHENGLGTTVTEEGGISGTVAVNLNLAFEALTADNKLRLVDATSKTLIAEFDATAFVKDSFLKSVSYNDDTNDLTFVFVDKDGKENEVPVALDDLVDIYVGDETTITLTTSGDGKVFKIKDGGVGTTQLATSAVTTEKIAKDAVTEAKLDEDVRDALDLARSALQESDVSFKANMVTDGTPGNFVSLDSDGDIRDSGYKATDFDITGAAANVQTAVTTGTITAKKAEQDADGNVISTTYAKVADLDSSVAATAGSVLTGVTITDGKLTDKTEVALHTVATSGSYNDLTNKPTLGTLAAKDKVTSDDFADEIFIFNCGTATEVI